MGRIYSENEMGRTRENFARFVEGDRESACTRGQGGSALVDGTLGLAVLLEQIISLNQKMYLQNKAN